MQKTISLHLEILGTDSTWQWKIFHRHGNGNSSISGKLPFPVQIKPKDVLNLLQSDNFQNRTEYANFGANLLKLVIPAELSEIFSAADNGDCLFEVPSPWASVPFELYLMPKVFASDLKSEPSFTFQAKKPGLSQMRSGRFRLE